jgi:hypothetical protein
MIRLPTVLSSLSERILRYAADRYQLSATARDGN